VGIRAAHDAKARRGGKVRHQGWADHHRPVNDQNAKPVSNEAVEPHSLQFGQHSRLAIEAPELITFQQSGMRDMQDVLGSETMPSCVALAQGSELTSQIMPGNLSGEKHALLFHMFVKGSDGCGCRF
jgi:hypothetical protein